MKVFPEAPRGGVIIDPRLNVRYACRLSAKHFAPISPVASC